MENNRMRAFNLGVNVKGKVVNIFVIPFDIPDGHNSASYLLVLDGVTAGSIKMGANGRWESEDNLPWDDEDLQVIGDSIGYHYILTVFW